MDPISILVVVVVSTVILMILAGFLLMYPFAFLTTGISGGYLSLFYVLLTSTPLFIANIVNNKQRGRGTEQYTEIIRQRAKLGFFKRSWLELKDKIFDNEPIPYNYYFDNLTFQASVRILSGLLLAVNGYLLISYYRWTFSFWMFLGLLVAVWIIGSVKDRNREASVELFLSIFLPVFFIGLTSYIYWQLYFNDDYFLRHPALESCKGYVVTSDVPSISTENRKIIAGFNKIIVSDRTCITEEGKYTYFIRPVYNELFSHQMYTPTFDMNSNQINEFISEIIFVSNHASSRSTGFYHGATAGIWESFKSMVKAIWEIIRHPIEFVENVFTSIVRILSGIWTFVTHPTEINLLKSPENLVQIFHAHVDDTWKKLAQDNGFNADRIQLPETMIVLARMRNSYVAGQGIFEIGAVVVGTKKFSILGKAGKAARESALLGKTEKAAQLAKTEKAVNAVEEAGHIGNNVKRVNQVSRPVNGSKGVDDTRKARKLSGENIKTIALADKKEFESRFMKNLKKQDKINKLEIHEESIIQGKGPTGTRRADNILVDKNEGTVTAVETKSPKEIASGKGSWCKYKDHLSPCREKVLSQFNNVCNDTTAWLIVVGCQINYGRDYTIKEGKWSQWSEYEKFRKQSGLAIPKSAEREVMEAFKKGGIKESEVVVKSVGDDVLIEISEATMDKLSKKLDLKKILEKID